MAAYGSLSSCPEDLCVGRLSLIYFNKESAPRTPSCDADMILSIGIALNMCSEKLKRRASDVSDPFKPESRANYFNILHYDASTMVAYRSIISGDGRSRGEAPPRLQTLAMVINNALGLRTPIDSDSPAYVCARSYSPVR